MDIPNNKAPGLDSYNSFFFFKTAWPIVQNDVSEAIMDFFATENLKRG